MEGYSAQLPNRADAGADCLDEMHHLVKAAGFRIAGVVGRAESEVSAADRTYWPAFEGASWFPALPENAGTILGSGCTGREQFALVIGAASMVATITGAAPKILPAGLKCAKIDDKRSLLSGAVPEADGIFSSLKHSLKAKASVEAFLETAAEDDPLLAPVHDAARRVREVFEMLTKAVGTPAEVLACGGALLKSPSLSQRMADALGTPLTLSTEPEPAGRGAALWALEQIDAIASLRALPASTAAVFKPHFLEITQ